MINDQNKLMSFGQLHSNLLVMFTDVINYYIDIYITRVWPIRRIIVLNWFWLQLFSHQVCLSVKSLSLSKELAWQHGYNAANDKLIRDIFKKKSKFSCTKPNRQICALLWRISRPKKLGSTYRLLRWNRVA